MLRILVITRNVGPGPVHQRRFRVNLMQRDLVSHDRLRQPVSLGNRKDKNANEVVREKAS
jgi:hypothetical protein